ncbi:MAG TPA: ion transporter, partial [Caulobacteraceae bacterium]
MTRKPARVPKTVRDPDDKGLRLRPLLRALYHGGSDMAVRFRLAVLIIDLAIIAFFIAAPLFTQHGLLFYSIDYAIAALLAADMAARAWAHSDPKDWLKRPVAWVDLFVLLTLLFPAWLFNLGFLRVVRLWT